MIYICIPTTPDRRKRLKELLASIDLHTTNIRHSVVVYENSDGGWVPAVHNMLSGIDGYVVLLGSDVVVKENWLRNLWDAFITAFPEGDGVAEPFNEFWGDKLCQHPLAHSSTIKKYLDKEFTHFYSDNWFTDQAKRDNKLIYVPEAIIEHRHFLNRKAKKDKTYKIIFDKATIEKDRQIYERKSSIAHSAANGLAPLPGQMGSNFGLPASGGQGVLIVAAHDGVAYHDYVRSAAREILSCPENTLSLLAGREFCRLRPEFYAAVRRAHQRFGTPLDKIADDLAASCTEQRRTWARRAHYWAVRGPRHVMLFLQMFYFVRLYFPLAARSLRRPAKENRQARSEPVLPQRFLGPTSPRISVVVLSYNRLAYLKTTLEAVLATADRTPYELIVVDNGSRDGSVEYLHAMQEQGRLSKLVLLSENQGTSAGYNYGFAAADPRSDYLMKLDSDITLLSTDWMANVIEFLDTQPWVGFAALTQTNHPMLRLLPRFRMGGHRVMEFAGWPSGGAMIIPRSVRNALGCFVEHPTMKYMPDDIDYCARAVRLGRDVVFLDDLLVYHRMDLDRTLYRRYHQSKPSRQSSLLAIELAREYDCGLRPLCVQYARYQNFRMPDENVLVID